MTAGETRAGEEKALAILYWQAPSLPGLYLTGGARNAGAITLEPLANVDPKGNPVPKLGRGDPLSGAWRVCGRWPVGDPEREGVKWSDGSDFTAEDAVFTREY